LYVPPEPDVLIEDIIDGKFQRAGFFKQTLAQRGIPYNSVTVLIEYTGLLPEIKIGIAGEIKFVRECKISVNIIAIYPILCLNSFIDRT
jgi:hypothetical protein